MAPWGWLGPAVGSSIPRGPGPHHFPSPRHLPLWPRTPACLLGASRVWGRSKFPEGRWSIERFIDSIEKPRDLLSLDPCFFGWKNSWAKFWLMRFYEILQDVHFVFFLCSRHENSYFVVKPHGGGFLLKCRFTRVTLLSPNFQRICFWKPSFWV